MKNKNWLISAAIIISLLVISNTAYAVYPYAMTYSSSNGIVTDGTILPEHINTSNTEHINNNIPESIDDYSVNATEMQTTRDPYPLSVVSLAETAAEEIEGLRYQLDAIIGGTFWYVDAPLYMTNRLATDFDAGTNTMTTGGQLTLDVVGTAIGAAGAINFGTDTAAIWATATELMGTSTVDIKWNAAGNDHIFQSNAVTQATIDDTGIDIITGNEYMINAASVLNATTLGSSVVGSSLTSVGTLSGLLATGVIDFGSSTSFEITNSATPTVDLIGEIALDTTVTGYHQGLMTYYGTETNYLVSLPTSNLTTTDGHIVAYNAANDEFEMVAPSSAGASTALDNLASVQINTTLISDTDITDNLGSGDVRWKDTWFETLSSGLTAADTLKVRGRDVDGAAYVDILTITSNNTVTADLWASTTIGGAAVVTPVGTSTLTNKTIDADGTGNSITNIENADIKAAAAIAVNKLAALTVSEIAITDGSGFLASAAVATYPSLTELTYLKGVTSAVQTQLGLKAPLASPTFTGTVTLPVALTGVIRADTGVVSVDSDVTDLVDNLSYTKLADGTDGELITWDAAGVPTTVAVGTAGQVLTSNGVGAAPTFQAASAGGGTENVLINGDFNIWQRGTSFAAITNGAYHADRFLYGKTGAMVHTVSRSTDVPTVVQSGHLSNYSLLMDCTTLDSAIATSDINILRYHVEGFDFLHIAQQAFTLSFWHKHTKTGTYCVGFRNSGSDRSYTAEYTQTTTDTWEKATITVSASPSAGTWNYTNGVGLTITFVSASGTDFHTTADTWQTGNFVATSNQVNACDSASNNFMLSQIQLELGSSAGSFEKRNITTEIARCQRYMQLVDTGAGLVASATLVDIVSSWIEMRAAPTLSQTGVVTVTNRAANYTQSSSSVTVIDGTVRGGIIRLDNFTSLPGVSSAMLLLAQGNSVILSAEL